MKVATTSIAGTVIVEPAIFKDERGSFFETFRSDRYGEIGISGPFLQDNCSISRSNVLRGIHYQIRHPQGRLITVTRGSIFDVGVDLRRNSPTFGRVATLILSADAPRQLYLPPGVAHGFCVLTDMAEIWYKCTEAYHADDESGLLWSDPDLGINWPLKNPIINSRDSSFPRLRDIPADRLPCVMS